MRLIGTILLCVFLVLLGLSLGAWAAIDAKFLGGFAIATAIVIALELANVIEK